MTAMVVLAFCVPLALVVRVVARDRAEHAGALEARSLAAVLAGSRDPSVLRPIVESSNVGSPRPATVFLPDGTVLGDQTPAGPELDRARAGQSSVANIGGGDEAVLVPVQAAEGTAVARVIVPENQLEEGVVRAWVVLGGLALGLVVLAVALADRLGRSLVRAGEGLQAVARRLGEGDRSARADEDGPVELAEVAREINRLADVIDDMLAAEREAAADLSHRLRTPLTALRLDVAGLPDGPDRQRLVGEVEALEVAVDAQIRAARGDGPPRPPVGDVDVVAAVRERMAFWSVLASDQERHLAVDLPDSPLPVPVERDDLVAAVDALLGNVFAHTPRGTPMRVAVAADGPGAATLVVEDDGPGFPDPAGLGRGRSGGGSTGLGLDIVRRTAEQSGGAMRARTKPDGGALVEVQLGPAAVAPSAPGSHRRRTATRPDPPG